MRGLWSFFKHRPIVSAPPLLLAEDDLLPVPGNLTPCAFSLQEEIVYAMCVVKERNGTGLLFQVLREIGKVPLVGLQVGAMGNLEMDGQLIPMQVVQASLPWISVTTSPEQSRAIQRRSFRVPASFSLRFRGLETGAQWQVGAGANISTGGFCFVCPSAESPTLGTVYESELTLRVTHTQELVLRMEVEVRWVSHAEKETTVGVRVTDPARCKDLTYAVSQLQHAMSRQPEDYLSVENQPLHLH